MPNIDNSDNSKTQPLVLDDQLLAIFNKLLPLIDNVSNGVRFSAFLGALISAWLFIWMFFILHWSLSVSLIFTGLVLIPTLILLRFWWVLEDIKTLPDIAAEIVEDVSSEVKSTWNEVRTDKKKALSFIGQAKNIWEMKSLLGQLDDMFGQYLNIAVLVNPFSLLLTILALLSIFVLLVFSCITVLTVIL